MIDFTDLVRKHEGARICVMGGAESLAKHMDGLSCDVVISTNGHGASIRTPDYVLAMDERHTVNKRDMLAVIRERTAAPIISPRPYADFQLVTWPQAPRDVLSGMVATWAAWMMGAKVVLIAGMDAYGGDSGYVQEAVKMARDVHCPVRVVGGGPLCNVWPEFNAKERFRYKPNTAIDGWLGIDGAVSIEVVKPTTIRGIERTRGDVMKVMRHEVRRLLHHKMVREV